ncbi:MAG TPA: ChrR family anti-sigma-E factor [Stellaceae bacterium]|nr:ChrR family anti-sigma-E factor [Stellaceae bacterium]
MMPHHHPGEATLLTYAAGALGEGLSLVVASHLAFCSDCRDAVAGGELIGGSMLDTIAPETVAGATRERVLAMLGTAGEIAPPPPAPVADPAVPAPLGRWLGRDLAAVPWRRLGPGLQQFDVLPGRHARGANARLLRIAPGRWLPRHGHVGTELTLVLAGSYTDELGHFARGDVAETDDEIRHQPVSDRDEDCICLIATEGPLRFESMIARLFQRFAGI